ncbi:MobF family relaxase [Corynebacterium sp. 21KM1197]|uniref:MobF family relaxase n=1 Tax=Corynebacterium sp. 21KM1197 TaxID=2989734 RepID=UPI0029C9BD1D|nr:MobF family relaxase [Corynebacterium sp. 21KM1197]WPF69827.1 MobF family relaxase [Corynebacterium sp. 21KM1197]
MVLTIAKMGAHSVAYYQSTVDESRPEDSYYSESGTSPAMAWLRGDGPAAVERMEQYLGVEDGQRMDGRVVAGWFNKALAPSGVKLGRAPRHDGVPGFDLTFCAPKSVSLLWGFGDTGSVRQIVDAAHQQAVLQALDYVSAHAGYTRRQVVDRRGKRLIIEKLVGVSGVKYEHRTSRTGDPHVHSHVLLANKQLCRDGKIRTLDGVSVYHEARAAGMVYQATLREILTRRLGVHWAPVVNGCSEIIGLDNSDVIKAYSTRAREIDAWQADNGLEVRLEYQRVAQKVTRRQKDTSASLEELRNGWDAIAYSNTVRDFIDSLEAPPTVLGESPPLPSPAEILAAVVHERSTFTRADVVEKTAELLPVGAIPPEEIHAVVEELTEVALSETNTWLVTPEKDRSVDDTQREGSQKYTTTAVIAEVEHGVDLATQLVHRGIKTATITPVDGVLSAAQADAMEKVVSSNYLASVIVAPAGAGKTSSLKAAHAVWNGAGKHVVGLAPTGKAADVMVGENVADVSMTIARAFIGTNGLSQDQIVEKLGWNRNTVVVVDEAGMASNTDINRVLEAVSQAQARVVFVGDPQQYSSVKSRSGMLQTLSYELPDAVELKEVFRQRDAAEREASMWLRGGEEADVCRAAQWYRDHHRLYAGSLTAMMNDAVAGWETDTTVGKQSLLVAATREQVTALNAAAQKISAQRGDIDTTTGVDLSDGLTGYVGDVLLTRRNDSALTTIAGGMVRNGQRWHIRAINRDGSVTATRIGDNPVEVVLPAQYLGEYTQLGYASTGYSAQGMTVDVARVVAGVGHLDKASVYVPMTRGRDGNFLYIAENQPGDTETGHGRVTVVERRESEDYARDVLIAAARREQGDRTPQAVFGQARQDWYLTRLLNSPSDQIKDTPFTEGSMAEYMAKLTAKREARFAQYHRDNQEQVAFQLQQDSRTQDGEHRRGGVREKINDRLIEVKQRQARCEEELTRIRAELVPLRAQLEDVDDRITKTRQELRQAESEVQRAQNERDSRGVVGRWWNKNTDKQATDKAVGRRENASKLLAILQQRRSAVAEPLEALQRREQTLQRDHEEIVSVIEGYEAYAWAMKASGVLNDDASGLMTRIAQQQSMSNEHESASSLSVVEQSQRNHAQTNPDMGMEL